MKTPRAAFIHSPDIDHFHYPPECPFKTERAQRTKAILSRMGYYTGINRVEVAPVPATEEELLLFHTPEYLTTLQRVSGGDLTADDLFAGLGTDDTPIFPDLYRYARLAAGGTLTGAKLIMEGAADVVFNPSGGYHHALAGKAGGFCYINDVVLACAVLSQSGKKVLCLDLDAHHGNGTQTAFYSSSRVFTVSLHESGETLYPWGGDKQETGTGSGTGFNMNLPFPAGTDDETYYSAYSALVPQLISAYAPDVIVLEIGMDILSVDPLTHFSMTNNVIADIVTGLLKFNKPILAVGGGGYSPEDTARGWALCWTILCEIPFEEDQYMGMGGVFLGNAEWNAGLRDRHIYAYGTHRQEIVARVSESVEWLRKNIFPYHGIG